MHYRQIDASKGGTLSLGLSYVSERPSKVLAEAYARRSEHTMELVVHKAHTLFPSHIIGSSSYEEISEHCKSLSSSFIDVSFPPLSPSLYSGALLYDGRMSDSLLDEAINAPAAWRRPTDFMKDKSAIMLFEGIIEPNDIKQGMLGDCWLMCAISSIAEFPALVEALFISKETSPVGMYQLRLCKNGIWTNIILDDYFPCYPDEGPLYSRAHGEELWVLLLEKAFAKVHGSYALLKSGFPFEAMMDLTGAPFKEVCLYYD